MGDDEPDPIEDWTGAEEHGAALGDYISEQDGYVHKDDSFRNEDGTFRRRSPRNRDAT